ncbi:MAG: hypothetical protein JWO36_1818 [Myxococcales bacterium]|nr:hypothetical protein [Myxococcales bacterium]
MTATSMLAAVALVATGCIKSIGPDVGPAGTAPTTCQGAACPDAAMLGSCDVDHDPAHDVSFSTDIMNGIFVRYKCKSCHSGGGAGKQDGKLDMASYTTLRIGGAKGGTNVILNGQPCESVIVQKVSPTPPFGLRMPRDSSTFLTTLDDLLLRDWIFEGARDN